MKIDKNHLYHGAALLQIAEHPEFTAINNFDFGEEVSRNAFLINENTGVYLKYASHPNAAYQEYVFSFTQDQLLELEEIFENTDKTFVGLICVEDKQICCLSYFELMRLKEAREEAFGEEEDQYTILVKLPKGSGFRVYVNSPGRKGVILGDTILVSRKRFPNGLFT